MVTRTKTILTRRPRTVQVANRRRPILTRHSAVSQIISSKLLRRARLRNFRANLFRSYIKVRRPGQTIRTTRHLNRRQRYSQRRRNHHNIQRYSKRQLATLTRTNSLLTNITPHTVSTNHHAMRRPPDLNQHRVTFNVTSRRQHPSRTLRLNSTQQRHKLQSLRLINNRHRLTSLMSHSRDIRRKRRRPLLSIIFNGTYQGIDTSTPTNITSQLTSFSLHSPITTSRRHHSHRISRQLIRPTINMRLISSHIQTSSFTRPFQLIHVRVRANSPRHPQVRNK